MTPASRPSGPTRAAGTTGGPATGAGVLAALGWDAEWEAAFAGVTGSPGRVARVDRGAVRVITAEGPVAATPQLDSAGVTGDWVAVDGVTEPLAVTAQAPRRSALVRRDPAPDPAPQTLAANMDQVWVTHAVDRPLRTGWLDRALVVAHGSGADALLVLTKADVDRDVTAVVGEVRRLAPHLTTVVASTVDGRGIEALAARLAGGRCAALLGRSGSGKSSLVNALAGGSEQRTGAVRAFDAKGRHTTTRRALVPVAGGSVIDTPGVRALGLWEPEEGVLRTFPDIATLARSCHFADCRHRGEPGCAVREALASGALPDERYQRFVALSEY